MKYLFIILLFSCSQPSGKIIISEDSTGITSGPARITIKPDTTPLRIIPNTIDFGGFNGSSYIRIRVSSDSNTLSYKGDRTITITGDTMKVIKSILESIEQNQKWQMKLYEENYELRKVIQQLIKEQNEIQHIRLTTDL